MNGSHISSLFYASIGFCNQCCDITGWKKQIDGRDMTTYWVCIRCEWEDLNIHKTKERFNND